MTAQCHPSSPDPKHRKLLVVLLGLLLFVPLTVWRSLAAFEQIAREEAPLLEYDCRGKLGYSPLTLLARRSGPSNIHRYAEVPDLPAIRLGTLHLFAPVGILEGLDAGRPVEYQCLRVAKEHFGANAWVFGAIERSERFPAGIGRLSEPIYLLHAGRLPAYLRGYFGESACLVSNVFEGTPAHSAGLLPGDLLMALDGIPLSFEDPCSVSQAIVDGDPRAPMIIRVVRDQVPFDLAALPPQGGESFGCRFRRLPLLDEATLARLPLVLEHG